MTHHRLVGRDGKLVPDGKLEEPFVIRPTSETIIGHMYAKWVKSYRDLPILINQWCNVMRWEMRTRMFLRTTEFLWQEGHTAHATADEAMVETLKMLDVYERFAEDYMAMPVFKGEKTKDERFPGADRTYAIEAMMQDRKALQAGTSHFLGQNFSKASEIKFLSAEGKEEFAWTTSWGVSTRLIGGLIMSHSDDNGLVLPPRLAPLHITISPIFRNDEEKKQVFDFVGELTKRLAEVHYDGAAVRFKVDNRDIRGGEKSWQHIKQGVPVRAEIGPRDVAQRQIFFGRRDLDPKDKKSFSIEEFVKFLPAILTEIQDGLFARAKKFRDDNTKEIKSLDEFIDFFGGLKAGEDSTAGGFAVAHWDPAAIGHEILPKLKVTPRCIPLHFEPVDGACIFTGKKTKTRVIFAKSY